MAKSCPTLCHPMDCSTGPGFPIPPYLPEFAQTHVHWIGVAFQPFHPLLLFSSDALNLSQHQSLFQWVGSLHQVARVLELQPRYWSFSLSISPSNEYSGLISFRIDWFDLLAIQGSLRMSSVPQFEGINSLALHLFYGTALTTVRDHWEDYSFDYMDLCQQSNVSAFQHTV